MKINELYNNDTLYYVIESVNQDLYFTWRQEDKILSSFRVEVSSAVGNTYKVSLTPPSYLQQERVEFINPRKIKLSRAALYVLRNMEKIRQVLSI